LGLHPGPWLKEVKEESADPAKKITIGDREFSIGELRKELLVRTEGQSLAYLTDFSLTAGAGSRRRSAEPPFVGATEAELTQFLKGCDFIVCEGQYREEDRDLARKNFHLTAAEAAKIAQVCGAKRLTLFHLSDRYQRPEWQALLAEARAVFKETYFPEEWRI